MNLIFLRKYRSSNKKIKIVKQTSMTFLKTMLRLIKNVTIKSNLYMMIMIKLLLRRTVRYRMRHFARIFLMSLHMKKVFSSSLKGLSVNSISHTEKTTELIITPRCGCIKIPITKLILLIMIEMISL